MHKNNNSLHSKSLSVSDFSLFASVAEQKLRTSEGNVSLHVMFDKPRNQRLPEELCWAKNASYRLYRNTYNDSLHVFWALHSSEHFHFRAFN